MQALIALLLISSTTLTVLGRPPSQTPQTKLSPGESQEVEQFVWAFNKRLRRTRDLTPFLTEPLAGKMIDRLFQEKENSPPLVSQELISERNLSELRKFWIATSNLAYLSELYVYTKLSVNGVRIYELPHRQQYPPNVARLMKRNPILSKWWEESDSDSSRQVAKTIEQVRSLTTTFQEAASLMRARFKAHPPEQTHQYRQNIVYLSKYLKVVNVDTCKSEKDCAGLPLHTRTITVNIPALTLVLVRMDGQLKILVIGQDRRMSERRRQIPYGMMPQEITDGNQDEHNLRKG